MSQEQVIDGATVEIADEVVGPAVQGTELTMITGLRKIELGLAAIKAESDAATWDVETTVGEKAAREFRAKCVKLRTSADAVYEEHNKPLLAAQRDARDLVKVIKAFVDPIEQSWGMKITAKEERKAAEKAAREQAERERIAAIRGRIAVITSAIVSVATGTAEQVLAKHEEIAALPVTEELYGDFIDEASGCLMRATGELKLLHARILERERQDAELNRRAAELVRQEAEMVARQNAQRAEAVAEQKRVADIQDRLNSIREGATDIANICKTSADTRREIEYLEQLKVTPDAFQEFFDQALALKSDVLSNARLILLSRIDAEESAARQSRLAETTRLQQVELKRQIDAFEADKIAAQKKIEADRAESDRLNRAELEALEEAQQAAFQDADRAAYTAPVASPVSAAQPAAPFNLSTLFPDLGIPASRTARPDDADIVDAVSLHFGVSERVANEWLQSYDAEGQHTRIVQQVAA